MNSLSLSISFLHAMRDKIENDSVNPVQRIWDESGHEASSPIATVLRLGALEGREAYDALVDFLMAPSESNRDENFRFLLRYALPVSLMIPEFTPVIRCLQITPHHKYDVYDHTIDCVLKSQRDPVVRLAAFFHDVGKPSVQEYRMCDDGTWRHTFIGHAAKSAEIARTVLERLDAPSDITDSVCLLVAEHQALHNTQFSENGVRRLMHRLGSEEMWDKWVLLRTADTLAHSDMHVNDERCGMSAIEKAQRVHDEILEKRRLRDEQATKMAIDIDGCDLLRLGIEQGPHVGECLSYLRGAVADGTIDNDHDRLLDSAREWMRQH